MENEQTIIESREEVRDDIALSSEKKKTAPPTVLENVRQLVQSKTRYEPDEIQPVSFKGEYWQYEMAVNHSLDATPCLEDITGHFKAQEQDVNTLEPFKEANGDVQDQLSQSIALLEVELKNNSKKYNQVQPGVYLKHPKKYWYLNTCDTCSGHGSLTHIVCGGSGRLDCYRCGGRGKESCGCNNGMVHCSNCNGRTTVLKTEYYQESYSFYSNGTWQTGSRPASRLVTEHCNSCIGGQVTCQRCSGSAYIECTTCAASGKVVCSGCSGTGKVRCYSCDGSGETGQASWVDVKIAQKYIVQFADGTPSDVLEMSKKEGVHGLPLISENLELAQINFNEQSNPRQVTTAYKSALRVVRQEIVCEVGTSNIVAYGNDLRWWTLDNIVEKLLKNDLHTLNNVILESNAEDFLSGKIDHLLGALKNMISSEINMEIVEKYLNKQSVDHAGAVSEEYARNTKLGITTALRIIYVRQAKRFIWKSMLLVLLVGLGVWIFGGLIWSVTASIVMIVGSIFWLKWAAKKQINGMVDSPDDALRIVEIMNRGLGHREAALIVSLPSIALVGILFSVLPYNPLYSQQSTGSIKSAGVSRNENRTSLVNLSDGINDFAVPVAAVKEEMEAPSQIPQAVSADNKSPEATVKQSNVVSGVKKERKQSSAKNDAIEEPKRSNAPVAYKKPIPSVPSVSPPPDQDIKLDSQSESMLAMAEQMYASKSYSAALDLAKQVLRKHPSNPRVTRLINNSHAEIERQQNEFTNKLRQYSK